MTNELLPADLTAAHLGQYIRISVDRPLADGEVESMLVVAPLLEVDHALVGPENGPVLATTVTLDLLSHRVALVLPSAVTVVVSKLADELAPPTE